MGGWNLADRDKDRVQALLRDHDAGRLTNQNQRRTRRFIGGGGGGSKNRVHQAFIKGTPGQSQNLECYLDDVTGDPEVITVNFPAPDNFGTKFITPALKVFDSVSVFWNPIITGVTEAVGAWQAIGIISISGPRLMFAAADAAANVGVPCYVDVDGVGPTEPVIFEIPYGENTEDAVPLITDGTRLYASFDRTVGVYYALFPLTNIEICS